MTVGQNYNAELDQYQSGFKSGSFGAIKPDTFKGYTIERVMLDVLQDTMTGMYMINTLTVTLTGNATSTISQITIYLNDSMYSLRGIIYGENNTSYALYLGNDTTVFNYFDNINGRTVDIQLVDE